MQMRDVFINQAGRLRSGWRLAVFCMLFLVLLSLNIQLLKLIVTLAPASFATRLGGSLGFVVQAVFYLIVPAVLAGWICCKFLEEIPARSLGWALHSGWFMDFLKGSLVGACSLFAAAAIGLI